MIISERGPSVLNMVNSTATRPALNCSVMSINSFSERQTTSPPNNVPATGDWFHADPSLISYMEFCTDLAESNLFNFNDSKDIFSNTTQGTVQSTSEKYHDSTKELSNSPLNSAAVPSEKDSPNASYDSSNMRHGLKINESFCSNRFNQNITHFFVRNTGGYKCDAVSQQSQRCTLSTVLPNLCSTSLFLDLQKYPKNKSLESDNLSLNGPTTTSTTALPLTTQSSESPRQFSNVHAEDEIVPALKRRLEKSSTLDSHVLENCDTSDISMKSEPFFSDVQPTSPLPVKPKREFLRKGSRNASTLGFNHRQQQQKQRSYQYYSNAVARKFGNSFQGDQAFDSEETSEAMVEKHAIHLPSAKTKSCKCVLKIPTKIDPRTHELSSESHVKKSHKGFQECRTSTSRHTTSFNLPYKSSQPTISKSLHKSIPSTSMLRHMNSNPKVLRNVFTKRNSSESLVNKPRPTLVSIPSTKKETANAECTDLDILTVQAQAKMAIVDEQISRLDAFQKELDRREQSLQIEKKKFYEEMDRERLQFAAERETELLRLEELRQSLKKERKKNQTHEEALEHIKREKGLLEDRIRKLRICLSEQEEEFKKREERYRKLVDRLNSKMYGLECRVKTLTHDLEERLSLSTLQENAKHSTPRQLSARSTASTFRSNRSHSAAKVSPILKKQECSNGGCQVRRLTQSTPATVTQSVSSSVPSGQALEKYNTQERESKAYGITRPRDSHSLKQEENFPLSRFKRLLEFDLKKAWIPFDEALLSLRTPEAMTLQEAPLARPDGRQEFHYNDGAIRHVTWVSHVDFSGHREIIFANGMRKAILKNGWILNFFSNGDIRGVNPSGISYYYFHSDTIYSITELDGTVFNSFLDGQVDCRFPDSTIQVRFPEGVLRQIDSDGTEHTRLYTDAKENQRTSTTLFF